MVSCRLAVHTLLQHCSSQLVQPNHAFRRSFGGDHNCNACNLQSLSRCQLPLCHKSLEEENGATRKDPGRPGKHKRRHAAHRPSLHTGSTRRNIPFPPHMFVRRLQLVAQATCTHRPTSRPTKQRERLLPQGRQPYMTLLERQPTQPRDDKHNRPWLPWLTPLINLGNSNAGTKPQAESPNPMSGPLPNTRASATQMHQACASSLFGLLPATHSRKHEMQGVSCPRCRTNGRCHLLTVGCVNAWLQHLASLTATFHPIHRCCGQLQNPACSAG